MAWADLLQRVWKIDGLRCPNCCGRMVVLAAVRDPDAITAILAAIHVAHVTTLIPARAPP